MTKFVVTKQYSVNVDVEIEAEDWQDALQKVIGGDGEAGQEEFRDWLEKSNWPVYNVDADKQEN